MRATELIGVEHGKKASKRIKVEKEGFELTKLSRKQLCMYPEEILGGLIKSPTSQWDNIDSVFQGMRDTMSCPSGYTSGTFTVSWTNACQQFWEVTKIVDIPICVH